LEGLNVRLASSEGETARLSGQISIVSWYLKDAIFARLAQAVRPHLTKE